MAEAVGTKLTIDNLNYGDFNGLEMDFEGYDKIPYRFSPSGFKAGKYVLEHLRSRFGEFKLAVAKEEKSTVDDTCSPTRVTLNYEDAVAMMRGFTASYRVEGSRTVLSVLSSLFPEYFAEDTADDSESELPPDIDGLTISPSDVQEYHDLLPVLAKYGIRSEKDLKRLLAGRRVLHFLRLEKVLGEFKRKLKAKTNESEWQAFFERNMLVLNPGYMGKVEKTNISLGIRFPDFLLLSIDGYVDVYEIKVPDTRLLVYDKSHKNYYWSSDTAKAISQVENYIDSLKANDAKVAQEIESMHDLKWNVVRPRGYIIAGHSKQLKEQRKNSCFRLLNESLNNTRILPYDSFLETFSNFSKTLKDAT